VVRHHSSDNPRRHPESPKGWKAALRRRRKAVVALGAAAITTAVTTTVVFAVTKGLGQVGGGGVPFTWSIRLPSPDPCVQNAVIGHPQQQARPPDQLADFSTWAVRVNATPNANIMFVTITLEGTSDKAVVLQAMRVKVVKTTNPPAQAFTVGGSCGGGLSPRLFEVVLDQPLPRLQPQAGMTQVPDPSGQLVDKTLPAVNFPYRISATDPEVFQIKANVEARDCEWVIDLDWTSGGTNGTTRIDDHGHPFRTISTAGKPAYLYDVVKKKWSLLQ
jgi:hypothetical protein